jgi:hypothetical protein
MRSPTATDLAWAVQTRGKSSDVAGNVVIGHGLAVGSPMRMREHALLTCPFGWGCGLKPAISASGEAEIAL